MPSTQALRRFIDSLDIGRLPNVFNPWFDRDPGTDRRGNGPPMRRERLRRHLAIDARCLLVGEASGYQGCHVSGIPFTSERLLIEQRIPRLKGSDARLSTRTRPWSEPSASTVWGSLHALGLAECTVLWNAFPWHPYRAGNLQSNRTPTPAERQLGSALLHALLRMFPRARVFAVGRHAEMALQIMSVECTVLRHPSMGGATRFRSGLAAAAIS